MGQKEITEETGLIHAERDFMRRRHEARTRGIYPRCWGMSSDALAAVALGYAKWPTHREYPRDPSDLMACQLTYDMAPPHLQKEMAPVLAEFRAKVEERYPDASVRVAEFLSAAGLEGSPT